MVLVFFFFPLGICLADGILLHFPNNSFYLMSVRNYMPLSSTVKWASRIILLSSCPYQYWLNEFSQFQLITVNIFVLNSHWWLIFISISVLIEPKIHLSTGYQKIITIRVSENMKYWKLSNSVCQELWLLYENHNVRVSFLKNMTYQIAENWCLPL